MLKLRVLFLVTLTAGALTLLPSATPAADPPSGATTSTTNVNNFLMVKPQYALSYSRVRGGPNWVSWRIRKSDLGSLGRSDDFRGDPSLPSVLFRVTETAFRNSGFDRGHMCPSGDRTSSTTDNSATFLMTNMLPQAPDNNRGPWAKLEEQCRTFVKAGSVVWVAAGGNGNQGTLAGGNVVVPQHTWKVIVVSDAQGTVTADTRVIAVELPNRNGIMSHNWRRFRTTVDHIEEETGNDFLSTVPASIQDQLESKVDEVND